MSFEWWWWRWWWRSWWSWWRGGTPVVGGGGGEGVGGGVGGERQNELPAYIVLVKNDDIAKEIIEVHKFDDYTLFIGRT